MMSYDTLPPEEVVNSTAEAIRDRGIAVDTVNTKEKALARLMELIPAGSVVMTGGSVTLTQIGLDDVLISGKHPWRNFKNDLLAEKDPVKQSVLRLQSTLVEYYLGGVNAIAETGELVWASATGSQLPAYSFTSKNVIWVAGTQKITPTLNEALARVREYVLPKESERQRSMGNKNGSFIGRILIFEREPAFLHRNLHLILVDEVIGF
jgi:hypothetical protein